MKLIGSTGSESSILIVGDFPTANEYASGVSFSGSTGNLVRSLFAPYNFETRNIYKTHYFKVPIPGYSSPIRKIREDAVKKIKELENWDSIIKGEIESLKPRVIVAMGELALQALTPEKGMDKWRGSILHLESRFQIPAIKVVPTHSPREIWSQNDFPFVYTQWDCGKAVQVKDLAIPFQPRELIWIARNHSEFCNWWDRARRSDLLTLDIETHHGFITCIGFCHDGYEAVSIPLLIGNKLDYQERGQIYKLVDTVLRSKVPKVNQNIKYDWSVLQNYGFQIENIIGDTMLMAHTIYPEFPVGLGFLNSIYTDIPYYKDEGKKFDPRIHSTDRLLKYNARDALCTWQIWKKQLEDADGQKVKDFYFKNVHPAFFTYKKMDQYGIRVDDTQRKKLIEKYEPQLEEIQQTINLVAEESINILSPAQVAKFIYEILKCPKITHTTPQGQITLSTGEEVIEELYVNKISDAGRKTVLRSLILARKLSKVLQFLRSPISPDGRMRTSYKLQGTGNGRTSAGKSIEPYFFIDEKGKIKEKECGGSFQTIPKHGFEFGSTRVGAELRSIFVPSPGYCFVEGDQGQAEDRVVCVLAEDWEGLEVLNKKEFRRNEYGLKDDRHTLTAMLVTSKPFEKITPDDRQERGKKPRHAGNYNMGPGMLAILTHFPPSECKRILDVFHSGNPRIRGVFHSQIREEIDKHRRLISPHGRRRDFFGRVSEDMYKQAFSTIPQATVSDHNKFTALSKLVEKFPEPLAIPLAESHDSLTFEVKNGIYAKFMDAFEAAIETPIDFNGCCLPRDYQLVIPGDIQYSTTNWKEMQG
jgi:uracil-DNA glycosylase family 4